MKDNRLKEQLFRNIREALIERDDLSDCDIPVADTSSLVGHDDDLCITFTKSFTQAGGTLHYCYKESDIRSQLLDIQHLHGDATIGCASDNLNSFLGHLEVDNRAMLPFESPTLGATLCEALIADQGSMVISSNLGLGVTVPALCDNTIVLAFTSQVVADWRMASERLKQLYPIYPDQIMVAHPASYACRKGLQKFYLILIEDETI